LLSGHVRGFDNVLDADRHAIDREKLTAGAPAVGRAVRDRTRSGDVVTDKSPDARLKLSKAAQAALEEREGCPCRR
jgi:hypothetical protein